MFTGLVPCPDRKTRCPDGTSDRPRQRISVSNTFDSGEGPSSSELSGFRLLKVSSSDLVCLCLPHLSHTPLYPGISLGFGSPS